MFKYLFSLLLFASILQAATISSQHEQYNEGQSMVFTVNDMSGDSQDWIGIYPAGSSNDWDNVVAWKWAGGIINGDITFSSVDEGNYEARAFFHNSFITEASTTFSVNAIAGTTISTQKQIYTVNESIVVSLSNMAGNDDDWVAIYPAGSSNAWDNVVAWKYTKGILNGDINLGALPAGSYDARAFFNNSYHLETSYTFKVEAQEQSTTINTQKQEYNTGESIIVSLSNMAGNDDDWIAIYPAGSSNAWDNVVAWKYTKGILSGDINLGAVPAGSYEVRAFFNNTYHLETQSAFLVKAPVQDIDTNAQIFIIGDSTVHNVSEGEMGWGSQLGSYMIHTDNAHNRARSGSSSKSYKTESSSHHDWETTKNMMQETDISHGAYLLIQFGHNDEKDGTLHTEPGRDNSYYNELKVFVNKARDLGFTPVLITPVSRQYVGSRTHGQYPQTMKYLAEDENVLLLDLEYKSFLEFKEYSSDAALQNVFSYDDGTHFNPTGAGIVAGWVKELACQKNQTLCTQFK